MSEKPLHVQVAEALGWTDCHLDDADTDIWEGIYFNDDRWHAISRYDTDWSATGPLIEKYQIALRPPSEPERCGGNLWEAYCWFGPDGDEEITGGSVDGPLAAVCRLLLKLKDAGKLAA